MIEAALAHQQYYKNELLIEPLLKYVHLIRKTFGPDDDQLHAYPGHPEIELALIRLYKVTGDQDAYDLAQYFVRERGNPVGQDGKHYYDWEAEQKRGESKWLRPDTYPTHRSHWYEQAHLPIKEQLTIEGHSVRALYLLTGVADLICLRDGRGHAFNEADQYLVAVKRLWRNMADRKMYVTGGVGAIKQWEGFGIDYFLPQTTDEGGCYSETCAAIAVMMLAERLLTLELDSQYADIMELCLYNSVMTGMSLDGKEFTYVNQLGSSNADKNGRESWFWCACCPPNFTRLFGSLGGYLWHFEADGNNVAINVHLYTTARLSFEVEGNASIQLQQISRWPWAGKVSFALSKPDDMQVTIRLRIPDWANGHFKLSPANASATVQTGYITLDPAYTSANGNFEIEIGGFEPRYLEPHPYCNQNVLCLARGPIVYCAEDVDNPWEENHFRDVVLDANSSIQQVDCVDEKHDGEEYVALKTTCWQRSTKRRATRGPTSQVVSPAATYGLEESRKILFIPYYYRANRGGKGQMRVGMINGTRRQE